MTTQAGRDLTRLQYRQQIALRGEALRDARRLWRSWSPSDRASWDRMVNLATPILEGRFDQSAQIARAYFEAMSLVETGSREAAVRAVPLARERIVRSLASTGLAGTYRALSVGFPVDAALEAGFVRFSGSYTRLALTGGRETIIGSVLAAPSSTRWERVTSSSPCAFCAMLASRGAVYVADTVDFKAHDHCSCTSAPLFDAPTTVSRFSRDPATFSPSSAALRDEWDAAVGTKSGTDALNAFRRSRRG